MGARLALGILLSVALLLAATWLWTGRSTPDAGVAPDAGAMPERAEASRETDRSPSTGVAASGRGAVEPVVADAAGVRLDGRLLVLADDGSETPAERARFTLSTHADDGGASHTVEVRDGRFALELARAGELSVSGLVLGTRPGRFERERHAFPEDGELVLRARQVPASVLRVLDAHSGVELRGVIVLGGVPAWRGRVAPGEWTPEDVLVEDGVSPIVLPPRAGVERHWVGAEGYGWLALQIDHDVGGEREARLSPAAWLEVLVDGPHEELPLRLRVVPVQADEGARPPTLAEARPDATGRALLRGLPAGAHEVRAEVGLWYDPPHVLAREVIELVAGERARVVLRLAHPLLELRPAVLAGELVLPEGHHDLDLVLRFRPADGAALRSADVVRLARDELTPVAGRPGVLRFEAGALTPGRYAAIVDPLQFLELFELPETGRRDLRLVLPALGRVEVEVVDAASDAPLALERLAWGTAAPRELRTWSYQNVEPHAPGRFAWPAPLGPIQVLAAAPGYLDANAGVRVEPGGTSLRLALRPLHGVRLTLRDGAATVPGEWSHSGLELRRLGEERELERGSEYELQLDDQAHWRVLAPDPGWYELRLPELPGFEPCAPLEVQLGPERLRELEIPLARAP